MKFAYCVLHSNLKSHIAQNFSHGISMVQYNVSPTFAELVGVPVALSVRSFDVTEKEGVISSASVAGKLEKRKIIYN